MNNVDNAIYHVLKIVHRNVVALRHLTSHTESDYMQLFLVGCHIQRLMAVCYVTGQSKIKQKNPQTCEFNLKLYMILHIC